MSDHRYEDDSEYDDDPQNAELDKLDEYLEMLYSTDDFARKIRGSQCIMQLSRSPENLEYLVTNGKSILFFTCCSHTNVNDYTQKPF